MACVAAAGARAGEGLRELFKDPEDSRLDASQWLVGRRGFLPVPLVITEPAVGYGGGLALAFFHRNEAPSPGAGPDGKRAQPPSISAVMAVGTENDTRLAGAAHLGIWRNDTIRYTGAAAAMDVHIKFYGGTDFPRLEDGVAYSLKGWGTLQQGIWRFGQSNLWLGGQLVYFDADARLETQDAPPEFDALAGRIENFGAGIVALYDSRDNILTPSTGIQSEWFARQHWGSFARDFEYTEIEGKNRWYLRPDPRWVVALRADASYVSEGAPFYALPGIIQRGIPRARYQGQAVLATEAESRYDIDGRWFAVAFAGVGRAADSFGDLPEEDSRWGRRSRGPLPDRAGARPADGHRRRARARGMGCLPAGRERLGLLAACRRRRADRRKCPVRQLCRRARERGVERRHERGLPVLGGGFARRHREGREHAPVRLADRRGQLHLRDGQASTRVVRLEAPHLNDERVRHAEATEVALHRPQPPGVLERLDQGGLEQLRQYLRPARARDVVEPLARPARRDAGAVKAGPCLSDVDLEVRGKRRPGLQLRRVDPVHERLRHRLLEAAEAAGGKRGGSREDRDSHGGISTPAGAGR